VAWKHDTFAIQPLLVTDEYRLLGTPTVLTPPRDGSMLDPEDVKAALDEFFDNFVINTVVMDDERAKDIAAWIEREKQVTVISWAQGNAQAAKDYDEFMKGLRATDEGRLRHNGDPTLRKHVMNAVARALPSNKRRFDRPAHGRAKRKQESRVIDCLTAAYMVNSFVANPPDDNAVLAGTVADYRITLAVDD
jgi:phage terminase large subunit-like protein